MPRPSGHAAWTNCSTAGRVGPEPGSRAYDAQPERHHEVAELLNDGPIAERGPDVLPEVLRKLMRDVDAPSGIAELGYTQEDIPDLVEGALKQQRLLVIAPRTPNADDLADILRASLHAV
ncbi:MAG TPA: iron-containing alcohol dehydrogenase [Candidatus Binatia bacterium]|nr:iron-containing alcohol dehydrogenase [Candidatus Binatia bacterium]